MRSDRFLHQDPDGQARRDEFTLDRRAVQPAIWSCKVGAAPRGLIPKGSDAPLRHAVVAAYTELVGFVPDFTFSGWGDALSEGEQAVVDNREPDVARLEAEAVDRLRCLPPWSTLRQQAEAAGWIS
jgi:hypothetical protein